MILEIVKYGHPALRAKGKRIEVVNEKIRKLAEDMFATMKDAEGVGLAAQQVGVPVQLCVLDTRDVPNRPSRMKIDGKEINFDDCMPLALVNPEVEKIGPLVLGGEGCLSFPGISADVARPEAVVVKAMGLDGSPIEFEAKGLLARAVQHEHDHLHGILFIDRLNKKERDRVDRDVRRIAAQNS